MPPGVSSNHESGPTLTQSAVGNEVPAVATQLSTQASRNSRGQRLSASRRATAWIRVSVAPSAGASVPLAAGVSVMEAGESAPSSSLQATTTKRSMARAAKSMRTQAPRFLAPQYSIRNVDTRVCRTSPAAARSFAQSERSSVVNSREAAVRRRKRPQEEAAPVSATVVPEGRIELPTPRFSAACSTTELPRHGYPFY